jgi:hypothetical protein
MNKETSFVVYEDIEVPEPVLRVEHGNRYGSVAGLDDDELLGPAELERAVYSQEFGPVLALPVKGKSSGIRPVVDETGGLDFGPGPCGGVWWMVIEVGATAGARWVLRGSTCCGVRVSGGLELIIAGKWNEASFLAFVTRSWAFDSECDV